MLPNDAVERLRKILDMLSPRSPERKVHVERIAKSYGCSESTVYRRLRKLTNRKTNFRPDKGTCRWKNQEEFETWIEVVAAIKRRSLNKKGHHVSTKQAIEMAERGFRDARTGEWIQIPRGILTRPTCDHWLNVLRLNVNKKWESVSVRFGAIAPNEVWQFDMSPSDMCYLDKEKGIAESKKEYKARPKLMLYSVIDDFSRVEYMEYHLCYGEDVEIALRFFYHAMSEKGNKNFPFQGVPGIIYMDNGPVARSGIFNQVMNRLNITIKLHETPEKAKGRTAARSKGKIERSFRTCKNSFESLFQFQKPKNISEANERICAHLLNVAYSKHPLWNEKRIDVWYKNLPEKGVHQICDWEEYRDLARNPYQRRVSNDRIITLDHQYYLVDEQFRNKKVEVWRGILDEGLFIRTSDGMVHGPYKSAPIPLPFGKFRQPKKTESERRREKVISLAQNIDMPKESVFVDERNEEDQTRVFPITGKVVKPKSNTGILYFVSPFTAKEAIFKEFGIPLGRLNTQQREKINNVLARTLRREEVMKEAKKIIDEFNQNATRNA